MNTTAFEVTSIDNDTSAFSDEFAPLAKVGKSIPQPKRCAKCGELLDKWNEPLINLRIRKRRFDMSTTYDGITIVSRRFIEVYREARLKGLEFKSLPNDDLFSRANASVILKLDAVRAETRFGKRCSKCKLFKEVTGAFPIVFVAGSKLAPRGFARSDLEFGYKDEKCPILVCGVEAAKILKAAKLKGMTIEAIEFE
jgi:hypothetical protein